MKSNKRYLLVALALLLATLLISGLALAEEPATVKLTGIKLNKNAFEVNVENHEAQLSVAVNDERADICITTEPADADLSTVHWDFSSSNKEISWFEWDNWTLNGNDVGSITLTIKAIDDETGKLLAKAEATVTFKEVPITEIYFRDGDYTNPVEVNIARPWELEHLDWCIGFLPENATYAWDFTWTNSDSSVARVSKDGLFTPLKVGETTVKVTSKGANPKSLEFKVKVVSDPIKSVSFTPNSFTLKNESISLGDYFSVEPNNIWDEYGRLRCKKVTWSSSDPKVANVSSNYYDMRYPDGWYVSTGSNAGTATLTLTITNYDDSTVTTDITVTSEKDAITSIKFIQDEYKLRAETETKNLGNELILKPDDIGTYYNGEYDLLWSSSDETIAKVSESGYVEAKKPGTATITVKCKHDETISAETKVTVTNITISKLKMPTTLSLSRATTTENKIEFTYEPYNAYVKDVTWTSSNPMVATIREGSQGGSYVEIEDGYYVRVGNSGTGYCYIDIHKAGTVTITVKVDDGETIHEASCVVTITQEQAETLKINKKKVTLYLHKSASDNKNVEQLYAYDKNKRYGDEDVTWSSSKKSVVSVDRQGNLTVHGKGKATITATMKDGSGMTAKCTVEVKKQNLKSISGNKKITLRVGQKATLYDLYSNAMMTFSPSLDKVYDDELIFKSSNRNIVSVNKKTGTLVANSVGTAEITVTSKANKKVTFTFKVKVIDAVQ